MKRRKKDMDFNKITASLKAQGYREKRVTITSAQAIVKGTLYALPFVLAFGLAYRFLLIDRAYLSEVAGVSFYAVFIGITVVSVILHELFHGIGWALSSGKGWDAVHFNISAFMPSCACQAALSKRKYLAGVLLPIAVLGGASVIFLFLYPGTFSVLTMIVNFILAGADIMIALRVLKEKDVLIADHPTEAGYIAFYK